MSDPGARVESGPAPVRRGRSRHGCHYRCRVRDRTCGAETRVVFVHRKRADRVHISPDDLVWNFREMFASHAGHIEES